MLDKAKLTKELTVLSRLMGFNIRAANNYFDIEISPAICENYFYTIYAGDHGLTIASYLRSRYRHTGDNSFSRRTLPLNYSNQKRILQHATLVLTEQRKELNHES